MESASASPYPFLKIQLVRLLLQKTFISARGHTVLFCLWIFTTAQYHSSWHFIIYYFAFLISKNQERKKQMSGYTFSKITQIFFSSNILFWKISHPSEKVNGLYDKNMHMLHLELLIVSILPHLISHSLILSLSISVHVCVDFFFFFLQLYFKKDCKPHGHLLFNLHHICSRIKPFSNKITILTHLIKLTIIP